MLFSDFIENGDFPLFGALSQTYELTTDISIDTDSGNVHNLVPDVDGITVTLSDPTTTQPENQIIINDTGFGVLILSGGVLYTQPSHKVFFFSWDGSVWVRYQADILGLDDLAIPELPIGDTEYKQAPADLGSFDLFGWSVAMSGDGTRCVAGAIRNDSGGRDSGMVCVYAWNGTTWIEEQQILPDDAGAYDRFGQSVSMNDDGTKFVAGAYWNEDTGSQTGAAYVFVRSGSTWTQEQKLTASDGADDDEFGWSVAMSGDGTRCIVGTQYEETSPLGASGAAYIYSFNGSTWAQEQKLISGTANNQGYFGYSVSMDGTGDRVVIGSSGDDDGGYQAGAAYVFTRTGTLWTEEQKLLSLDLVAGDIFGISVAISDNGERLTVGAPNHGTGGTHAGAAYVFSRSGTAWTQEQKLVSDDVVTFGNDFSRSISINADGSKIVVGVPKEESLTGLTDAGCIYVFVRTGVVWTQDQRIESSVPVASDNFGQAVSVSNSGSRAIIGAYGDDSINGGAGAIYII